MNHSYSGIDIPDRYDVDLMKAELSGEKAISGNGVPKNASKTPNRRGFDPERPKTGSVGGNALESNRPGRAPSQNPGGNPSLNKPGRNPGQNKPGSTAPPPSPPPSTLPDPGQFTPAKKPTSPPPSIVPQKGRTIRKVDSRAIKGCLYHYTYLWLRNGMSFWFYPIYIGRTSMAGYRWTRFGWTYAGMDLSWVEFFERAN